MKNIYLTITITLLILSLVAGDTRIQFKVNNKCISSYSETDNPTANNNIKKSKLNESKGLHFSVGIVITEYSF